MTEVWDLRHPADGMVRGEDANAAVAAVREVDQAVLGLDPDKQGIIVFRHPRAIVFMPWTKHIHDQDCNRA